MPTTLRNRLAAALAVTVLAAAAQALGSRPRSSALASPAPSWSGSATVAEEAPGDAAERAAVRYWTPARMAAVAQAEQGLPATADAQAAGQPGAWYELVRPRRLARQAPAAARVAGGTAGAGLRWSHGGAVAAAVGKVFFTLGRADYVCSGTLAGSGQTDVVVTAAHCVSGGPVRKGAKSAGEWAANWVFVPGYHNGAMPAGEYTARRFFVPAQWAGPEGGTEQYDVAFVQLTRAAQGAGGRVAPSPHGLPLRFAAQQNAGAPGQAYVFGYPAEPPYSGLYADFCAGPAAAAGGSVRTACSMTAGDSGGPWLAGFTPRSGAGQVFAVTTYKLSTSARELYGAVLGPRARALYERAVSTAR